MRRCAGRPPTGGAASRKRGWARATHDLRVVGRFSSYRDSVCPLSTHDPVRGGSTRRRFLHGAAAGTAALALAPAYRVRPAEAAAAACTPPPPDFPAGIDLYLQAYENWAKEIVVGDVWTCAPRSPGDVVRLANWARRHHHRLRPQGARHGWAPLTLPQDGAGCDGRVVLVDTRAHLTGVEVRSTSPGLVRVQAGTTMDVLLHTLEAHGLGFTAVPAPGDITVGGALAIDAHGTAVPAAGETRAAGQTFGSLSNRIVSLTAVVWSPRRRRYVLRTYPRSHPACAALATNLGRAFVTAVELRAGADVNLRCVSDLTIPWTELFADPATAGPQARTFARALDATGRAEAIWFPYTEKPWLKTWSVSPERPAASREVRAPYNYLFSDQVPVEVSDLATRVIKGEVAAAEALGQASYAASVVGLAATQTGDIWGASKNLLLYIRPTTIRATANGYVVLCRRADVQQVVHDFAAAYHAQLERHRAQGSHPVTVTAEIRVTGLDQPGDVEVEDARSPTLSALHPRPDHPEWDTGVWLDVLTFPGQPGSQAFYRELEQWILGHYTGRYGAVRPEWSKGWGYSGTAGWTDETFLAKVIPAAHRRGRRAADRWDAAVRALDRLDPHRIFANSFHDRLLVAEPPPRRRTGSAKGAGHVAS